MTEDQFKILMEILVAILQELKEFNSDDDDKGGGSAPLELQAAIENLENSMGIKIGSMEYIEKDDPEDPVPDDWRRAVV